MRETTIGSRTVFKGRLLTVDVLDVELENGVRSTREVVRHRGAAAVLARLPDGRFVLVRQFRKPVEREVLEIVAGLLEEREAPEACARREVREETGHEVEELVRLGTVCPSVGCMDEHIQLFYARLADGPAATRLDHDEHVETVVLSAGEITDMIRRGAVEDAKTLAAWLLYEKMFPNP
ncbi:MAG TPA: NUDIX hydrolase [Kiritimatiellia bacterium]|nr:NUDIX hydrolase [Kiritimatiellia bacterium]HNS80106.1 NUDIX hydrolase [Kiritimatiellia bacterium]HPA77414.1 NUDIX hydrolase [Kiritimatiellia bacterium]HQQ03521.1 NUDIX hydrolase [Kiritimatiellia bacterium]